MRSHTTRGLQEWRKACQLTESCLSNSRARLRIIDFKQKRENRRRSHVQLSKTACYREGFVASMQLQCKCVARLRRWKPLNLIKNWPRLLALASQFLIPSYHLIKLLKPLKSCFFSYRPFLFLISMLFLIFSLM